MGRIRAFVHDDECNVLRGFADPPGMRRPCGSRLFGATTVRDRDKVDHRNDPFSAALTTGAQLIAPAWASASPA